LQPFGQALNIDLRITAEGNVQVRVAPVVGSRALKRAIVIFTNSQNGRRVYRELAPKFMGTEQPAIAWLGA
jgi:hypothetical protein